MPKMAGRLMWQLIKPHQPQVLIGPGFGASPLLYSTALAALADGAELQVLMVRDKRKAHNQKRWVEGDHASAAGKRAVMLDDFMKAGSALPLVRDALRADSIRLDIVALALFFDMWEPLGSRQISTSQLPVLSLFTRHDIGLSRDCHDAVPPLMKGSAPDFLVDTPRWWRMGLNKSLAYPTKCAPVMADGAVFIADEKSTLWKHDLGTVKGGDGDDLIRQDLTGVSDDMLDGGAGVDTADYSGMACIKANLATGKVEKMVANTGTTIRLGGMTGRYIRIYHNDALPAGAILSLTGLKVYAGGVDVAAGKAATTGTDSGSVSNFAHGASALTDGAVGGSWNGKTGNDSNLAWVQGASKGYIELDLGSVQTLDSIALWGRADGASESYNLRIYVSKDAFVSSATAYASLNANAAVGKVNVAAVETGGHH
jgi:orotate phosphoribosyltransferase